VESRNGVVGQAFLCQPAGDEKHYRQLSHRLGIPLIREVLAAFRREEISAAVAAEKLGLGRTRLYKLYADYLRAVASGQARHWQPGASSPPPLSNTVSRSNFMWTITACFSPTARTP